jgi:hypothetical protein
VFDIIFISYNEPNADDNWKALVSRFPYARRIYGVKGIHQAHRTAARLFGLTEKFWVVDGDTQIKENFKFTPPHDLWEDAVYVYRAQNPVNNLVYGYGGLKLLPKIKTAKMDIDNTDMTTSISGNFFIIDEVASTTCFNTDPFNTWKSAFRECVKLSSKIINNQIDVETEERLDAWCTLGQDQPYGEWCIKGARDGKEYGSLNTGNTEAIKRINDFNWLTEYFESL